ncbi:MAG TPA: hypothetical protein VN493_26510 [Thermoanaerobaculia bacterium]|nr:hypothetical protein [Thermoanaerobaculia bacterium]
MPIRSNEDYDAALARQDAEAAKERARAERLWRRLQDVRDPAARRDLAVGDPDFWTWAFCEKLSLESAAAAEDDAGHAGELADLALELVSKAPGDDNLRCRIQEYVWAHVSNARRARGDLAGAERAITRAQEFFIAGTMGILPSPIRRDPLFLIEAALLRDQGRLREALEKVKFGWGLVDKEAKIALFLEDGRLHRWLGHPEKALWALSLAARDASRTSDLRLLMRIEIEAGSALCDLGRHGEVKKLSAGIRRQAGRFPAEQARLLALEGRVAAGLGRLEEAEDALRKLRADLPDGAAADFALLSLEVAVLYASQGKTAELKDLAATTQGLAGSRLSRGAAASLKLFCRLAEQEKLTPQHVAQFAKDFPRGPF